MSKFNNFQISKKILTIGIKQSADSHFSPLETKAVYQCDLKSHIGADTLDSVALTNDGLYLFVDGEGHGKGLKHNFFLGFKRNDFPVQTIIGQVLFARLKPLDYSDGEPYDYEIDSITESDIELINKLLAEDLQNVLKEKFIAMYGNVDNPVGYWNFNVHPINIEDIINGG